MATLSAVPAKMVSSQKKGKTGASRVSSPKVRTGCKTCKIRHKKCDERMPTCSNCIKSGFECSYPQLQSKPTVKSLLPKKATAARVAFALQLVPRTPSQQLFDDQSEYSSFNYYYEATARELSGAFKTTLWSQIIPQACHSQPFLRHALITIGALSHDVKSRLQQPLSSLDASGKGAAYRPELHRQLTLMHIGKFLEGARKASTAGAEGKRTALIVCLLLNIIEAFQTHASSPVIHVRHAFQILEEWMADKPTEMYPFSSPEPDVIEDDIIQHFKALEVESITMYEPISDDIEARIERTGAALLQRMPTRFADLKEAQGYLQIMLRRRRRWNGFRSADKSLRYQTPTSKDDVVIPSTNGEVWKFDIPVDSDGFEAELYASGIRRWASAFDDIYKSTTPSDPNYLSIIILKMRSKHFLIDLAIKTSSSEMDFDSYYADFQEIINLSRIIIAHPTASTFLRDGSYIAGAGSGVIDPLCIVIQKCRDRWLRREALATLRSRFWREGELVSSSCASLCEWMMRLEEENVETDFIPSSSRVRLTYVLANHNLNPAEMVLKCHQNLGPNCVTRSTTLYARDHRGFAID